MLDRLSKRCSLPTEENFCIEENYPLKLLHRLVKKFSHFSVSIQQANVQGISVQCIIVIVVLIICRKFHPFSSPLTYFFEENES